MGGDNSKLSYRSVVVQLTTKTQPVDANDNEFWDQFWTDVSIGVHDIFVLIPAGEIRALREESPNNLATLSYKAVERLSQIAEASFPTPKDQQVALNCIRLLTRLLPYIFEDPEWRSFFWSALPSEPDSAVDGECVPLAQSLISAVCDLLFCPDFTVHSIPKNGPEGPEDMHTIDSCEYIWQAGVGFAQNPAHNSSHDLNRTELLKLLLTCFSETMYLSRDEAQREQNRWVSYFTSANNRHALPLFASLLNVVCAYDPVGFGLPYNYLMFSDTREPLVEVALQVLCIVLEAEHTTDSPFCRPRLAHRNWSGRLCSEADDISATSGNTVASLSRTGSAAGEMNLFVNYMSRIHRDEDFAFILSGLTRLLNNPLQQTYLPGSTKKVQMHQELLVLFWRTCEINKKFMYYVLKSSQVLDLLVPILYQLNDARSDPARLGLVHVGVFILLLLSGERNFGVRLNKPYKHRVSMDVTVFTGTHADLLIIVFHKLITCGHRRLQPLYDCLLTIIANVSPYLKSLSMVTANKLLHLLEAFSQPWFLYTGQTHYQLVFLLLEVFNNIIQYQFDGKSIILVPSFSSRKFLPTSHMVSNILSSLISNDDSLKTGSPNALQATLADTPEVGNMTDQRLANMGAQQPPHNFPNSDGMENSLENVLVSHSSPSRRSRSLSETATHTKSDSSPSNEESDGLSSVPLNHPGIAQSSLLNESAVDSTAVSKTKEIGKKPCHSDKPVTCKPERSLRGSTTSTTATDRTCSPFPGHAVLKTDKSPGSSAPSWVPTPEWVLSWKAKMPFQTIMRLLQVLVPQVEKICIDKGLTDESEIVKFLQNGTLVGLLPVPHPILIRKYQSNSGTAVWFRNYLWGVIYLRLVYLI
ncbi:hypothetical protein P879_07036 [Paragonimus westermani]|uniref:Protein HID1 n=1 Tax=Paragonimus westermani TaxID=34504 RepID=A0A8T0DSX3_9TREM|nr:hypothetical protein P879_07036 [Paragonimus westermani]